MAVFFRVLPYGAAFLLGGACFALPCACDYAALKGKRLGPFPLSVKYGATMGAGGVLAALCLGFFGLSLGTALRFGALVLLAAVTLTDLDTMEIPDWLNAGLAVLGLLSCFLFPSTPVLSRVIGLFCVSAPMALTALLIPNAFGGGDIKLMAACGLLLGWKHTLLAAFIGILLGGVWGAILLISKKKRGGEVFAFGPCLCAGVAVCLFFGDRAVNAFVYIFDFSRFF